MDYRKELIVEPGRKVRLKDIDPAYHGKHEGREQAQPEIEGYLQRMEKLQELLYAERKHAMLIVLQGIDAAGKDGVCWHVVKGMNPQGCSVTGFKQPSPEELAHDFLWRVHQRTPALGHVGVFNRSHYEDVLIARVDSLVPRPVWQARYRHINEFERMLVESDIHVVKIFLHLSKAEQRRRFEVRIRDPRKQWKFDAQDLDKRRQWAAYRQAFGDMLGRCNTHYARWYVVPADHKWLRDLAVTQIMYATLKSLALRFPPPRFNPRLRVT
jgi:PPK2 family polyphosphate:nucleotide phosphotransferase